MTRRRPHAILAGAAVIALAALSSAGCGGGDDGSQATATPPNTSSGHSTTVEVANSSSLGKFLTDSRGRTVYVFGKDTGTTSTCSGACAVQWPPVIVKGQTSAGGGATASKVGTTKRSDGSRQVTYNGHPVYRFKQDQSPGDVNGQGINAFGGTWHVISPAGAVVTTQPSGGNNNVY
jgi:predicted lipoprotein with Yx(FWY)xxD motif